MVVAGAIVPHAPLLVGAIGGANSEAVRPVRAAVERLAFPGAEALVVLSPHGTATGVHAAARGSLRPFGIDDAETEAAVDTRLCGELAESWGAPLLVDDLDHGSLVPVRLLADTGLPVACASLVEGAPVTEAVDAAARLARALVSLARPVAFVASAHTSAALSARAPLGLRAGAVEADRRLIDWLTTGRGDGRAILEEAAGVGGSCSAGPLAAFAELFPGRARVDCYESPFGVGYLVAGATQP